MRLGVLMVICMTAIGVWAQNTKTVTILTNEVTVDNTAYSVTQDGITLAFTSTGNIIFDKGFVGLKNPGTLKVSSSNGDIASVTITYSRAPKAKNVTTSVTSGTFTLLATDTTSSWTEVNAAEATLTYSGTVDIRISSVDVTYTPSGSPDPDPTPAASDSYRVKKSGVTYKSGASVVGNYITMTLGGMPGDANDSQWSELSKHEGSSSIVPNFSATITNKSNDALKEGYMFDQDNKDKYEVTHAKASDGMTLSELPAYGNYYKFEPNVSGKLTVYVQQQGSVFSKSTNEAPDYTKIRVRPLYLLDEKGYSLEAYDAATVSKLDDTFANITSEGLNGDGDNLYTTEQMKDLHAMYSAYIAANNLKTDGTGDNKILVLHSNGQGAPTYDATADTTTYEDYTAAKMADFYTALKKVQSDVFADANNDNTGYFLITEGYARYGFNVEAGKTYYLFGLRTKIGLAGYDFTPDDADEASKATSLTLNNDAENENAINSTSEDNRYNVTVNRTFTAGEWTSLVLPFNVSTTALHEAFGETEVIPGSDDLVESATLKDVDILNFTDVTVPNLNLTKHFNQMIVAGTPVFIRPKKTVTAPVFKNVKITAKEVTPVTAGVYTFNGSYNTATAPQYSYVMHKGQLQFYNGTKGYAEDAMAGWITSPSAQKLTLNVIGGNGEGGTTGIIGAVADYTDGNARQSSDTVYDLNGQKVGSSLNLNTLQKGVYVKGGKKYIVK